MFNKLVSSLPFNPSTVDQLAFYGRRLKKEHSIRRLGLFFIIASMFVQMFAALIPAEKSLAYSDNHIINGLKTRADILRAWDRPGSDVKEIYSKFGVTRADLAKLSSKPNATIRSSSKNNYWSIGRNSLSGYSDIKQQYKSQEIAVNTDGPTIYMRPLHAWDTKTNYTSYKAFKGRNTATGKTFWILVDCGNYAQVGKLIKKEAPKKPQLEIRKTITTKSNKLKPGDTLRFKLEYRNKVADSLAEDVKIEDQLDIQNFDIVTPKPSKTISIKNGKLTKNVGNLKYSKTYKSLTVTVKLKSTVANGTTVCNAATIDASNAASVTAGGAPQTCIEVARVCPNNPNLPDDGANCVEPIAACTLTESLTNPKTGDARFTTTSSVSDTSRVTIVSYDYNFGDGTQKSFKTTSLEDIREHTYKPGSYLAKVIMNYTVKGAQISSKKTDCSAPIEVAKQVTPDEPVKEVDTPVSLSKDVKNITRNLSGEAAIDTKLRAGDVIEYTLVTANTQSSEKKGYDIADYVGDVVDYADIDNAYLASQGGTYNASSRTVIWANQTLPAKSETSRNFRVVMKDPIPSTNSPSRVSTNFDCKISNQYGEEISMDVTCPTIKEVEQLPNTGPGTTIAVAFVLSVISGYFFARARLLAVEVGIIRKSYQ